MAVRPLSVTRSTLSARDTDAAIESAHRVSEEVLFVRQAGAIQGQLESSTEFHSKRGLCRLAQAREMCARACYLLGEDYSQEGVWLRKNWPKIRRLTGRCLRPHE
jgi:hypothetical protein